MIQRLNERAFDITMVILGAIAFGWVVFILLLVTFR